MEEGDHASMTNQTNKARKTIRVISNCVDYTVMVAFFLLFIFGTYSLWDSNQIYAQADKNVYAMYKPSDDDDLGYEEMKRINSDTNAWLTVYGTDIDYPVFQAEDNEKYVHTDAKGKYSMTGALFLDYRNSSDYSDFSSIIYGHHMEKGKMFGNLSDFRKKNFFDSHEYGKIYIQDAYYGIHFMAYLSEDAYNTNVYRPTIQSEEDKSEYLSYIKEHAQMFRDVNGTTSDRYILLSTCSSLETNGRTILIGKITDDVHEDPYANDESSENHIDTIWDILQKNMIFVFAIILIILIILSLVIWSKREIIAEKRRKYKERRRINE